MTKFVSNFEIDGINSLFNTMCDSITIYHYYLLFDIFKQNRTINHWKFCHRKDAYAYHHQGSESSSVIICVSAVGIEG